MKKQLCILLSASLFCSLYSGEPEKTQPFDKPKITYITVHQVINGQSQSYNPLFGTFTCNNGEVTYSSSDSASKEAVLKMESHMNGYNSGLLNGRIHGGLLGGLTGVIAGLLIGTYIGKR